MAAYTIEQLKDQPIVIFTAAPEFNISQHLIAANHDAGKVISSQNQAVFYIQDLRQMRPPTMDELMFAADLLARSHNALYHHPQIRREITVTSNMALRMSLEGMNSEIFGNVDSLIVETLEEALEYARGER
ncbi:MAG: hypothetical protein HY866_08660 [Chloroflexi bacterium]|nr:hypothetical protein [Chloroflexota bacterium]